MAFKPTDYSSVSPYFVCTDAERLALYIELIFHGERLREYKREDGSIMHLEMRIDDTVLMLADATEQYPTNEQMIHVYVPDAKATYAKALEHGGEGMGEPEQREGDPDLRGTFRDFEGNVWSVSTQMEE